MLPSQLSVKKLMASLKKEIMTFMYFFFESAGEILAPIRYAQKPSLAGLVSKVLAKATLNRPLIQNETVLLSILSSYHNRIFLLTRRCRGIIHTSGPLLR